MVKTIALILATNEEKLLEKARTEGLSALEHAILIDKLQLLSGDVTERVGHVLEVDPEIEEFRRYAAAKEVPAMVLGMGLGSGSFVQEGGEGGGGHEGAALLEAVEGNGTSRDDEFAEKVTQYTDNP